MMKIMKMTTLLCRGKSRCDPDPLSQRPGRFHSQTLLIIILIRHWQHDTPTVDTKMIGGTPEICSFKSLTPLTFYIWYLTFDIWFLTFDILHLILTYDILHGPMEQWTDGPRDQWINDTMDHWTSGPMDQWTNGPMDQWSDGPMDQWSNGLMDQWTNGPMDKKLL